MVGALELGGVDHTTVSRCPVDVHVENRKKNTDAAHAPVDQLRFLDFHDVGDASVGRRNNEARSVGNGAGRIAKKPEGESEQATGEDHQPPRAKEPRCGIRHGENEQDPFALPESRPAHTKAQITHSQARRETI